MDLQELITRGRFIMSGASERIAVFDLVNGKMTAKDIAKHTKRHVNNVRRDLSLLSDSGIIEQLEKDGKPLRKGGFAVYDKVPLARTIPLRYFTGPSLSASRGSSIEQSKKQIKKGKNRRQNPLQIPLEQEILDIAKNGETQDYEFKGQGCETRKLTREIAAMLNTKQGGQVFYGISDDGDIEGSDITYQKFDQSLQNSVRSSISPPATIRIHKVNVIGSDILIITVPPWNGRQVYMFEEKVLIRRGTNVFAAKPEDLKSLHSGKAIV
jgi:predicted HTH transcriptional regulator